MTKLSFKNRNNFGFTLVELLVVISIIGILVTVSIFGLAGARESSRDARRKADLELVRSGLEIYKADCGTYPANVTFGGVLNGTGTCSGNTYISVVPTDPITASRTYRYDQSGSGYTLCAALEQGTGSVSCGGTNCGVGSTVDCNYQVTNP